MQEQSPELKRARQGDPEAFGELVASFEGMVYRHCLQMMGRSGDAQDAAQEAMLRAFRAIPRFMGQSGVGTWLFRIAHNTCLDMLKKPARKRENVSLEALQEAGFDPQDEGETPESAYSLGEEARRVREALARLPSDQQALLNLRYGDGLSYAELSKVTGLREGTVKSKLNRAKARLREILETV